MAHQLEIAPLGAKKCPQCDAEYPSSARFCLSDGSALVDEVCGDPLVGTKLDGRYLVLRRVGEGGMGCVYEGVQLSIDRPVAIKLIHGACAISRRQRRAPTRCGASKC